MRRTIAAAAFLCFICGPALALAGDPIAETDGEAPGTSLKVTELKASNGTVMLKFTIVNDGPQTFDPDTLNDTRGGSLHDAHAVGGVYLIDAANKKNIWPCSTRTTTAFAAATPMTYRQRAAPICG